jgi:phosphoribosyl-ATP pyrophosphohydrolase
MSDHIVEKLAEIIKDRRANPREGSYVAKIIAGGTPLAARKVGEEAVEVAIAAMEGDHRGIVAESADLFFHTLLLLSVTGVEPAEVWAELESRFGKPGGRGE